MSDTPNTNKYELVDQWTLEEFIEAIEEAGSINQLCRDMDLNRHSMQTRFKRLKQEVREHVIEFTDRTLHNPQYIELPSGGPAYYIISSAQNETSVNQEFMDNLEAYAEYLGATILIAGFTYNKKLFEDHSVSGNSEYYHPRVQKYLTGDRFHLGPGLDFLGEMNTLPTAVWPLSGFETNTEDRWGVFPHAKVQLESIPTSKSSPPKVLMTTGAVTMTNYVGKRAGRRAEFHHSYGAVLVTLYPDGEFTCRHLLGDSDTGSFYDLNVFVGNGEVTENPRVLAVQWGDIHLEQVDASVANLAWFAGKDSILEALKPEYQFCHDTIDFTVRNHHNINDPLWRFKSFIKREPTVEETMVMASEFLQAIERDWCQNIVVESNHDLAFQRWLKESDYRRDPPNAIFFLDRQKRLYESIRDDEEPFSIFEDTMRKYNTLDKTRFLHEDESFVLKGEIECGMHGHLGANGSRPTPKQFTKMGMKANTGHTHSCSIYDGVYTAGTFSKLDLGYNKGLSSWSHSMIVTYPNAKRTIVTVTPKGKWR